MRNISFKARQTHHVAELLETSDNELQQSRALKVIYCPTPPKAYVSGGMNVTDCKLSETWV